MMVAFWGTRIYVVLAQERISPVFRRFSGIVETSLRVMAKAMRAAAMKAMKAVNKGTKAAFFPTKAMRAAKATKAMKAVSKATKQAIVPTKAMRAAAMKAMKVVSKAAKEQAFVATKAMRKAKAAAPAPKKAMK